jgi:hypothetical protein
MIIVDNFFCNAEKMAAVVLPFSMSMLSKRNLPKFEHPCEHCSQVGLRVKKCGRCKLVYYCGVECQTAAWEDHKTECAAAAKHPDLEATRQMRTQFKKLVLSQYATCKKLADGKAGVFVMTLIQKLDQGIVFEFYSRQEVAEKPGRGWSKAIEALDRHDASQCVIGALADAKGNFIGSVTVTPTR